MKKGLVVVVFILAVLLFFGGGMPGEKDKLRVEFEEEEDGTAGTKEKLQIYTTPGFTALASTKVKNKGNVEGYVFIEVRVPVIKKDELVLEKGVKVKGGYVPVMEFEVEKPWVLVEEEISSCVLTQVYCYGDLRPLRPGETTEKLFNEWSVVNCRVVNGVSGRMRWEDIGKLCTQTEISVCSIQTNLGSDLTPESVWTMLK